jgi:hypothetical protein
MASRLEPAMSKMHGTFIVVLLAILVVVILHRSYLKKPPQPGTWEYQAAEGDKIDLAALQQLGADGFDCAVIAKTDTSGAKYIVLCKRYVPHD